MTNRNFEIVRTISSRSYTNVIFDPRYSAFFDESGALIEESVLIRGADGIKVTQPPDKITLQSNCRKLNAAVFIGSFGYNHFGHFMTEQIAKLWFMAHTDIPVVFHNNAPKQQQILHSCFDNLPAYQKTFIAGLSFCKPAQFLFIKEQVYIEELILPEASFVNRRSYHQQHSDICKVVARHLLSKSNEKPLLNKVYLSRSRLHSAKRKVIGEEQLELMLSKAGFKVLYPEKMSLQEQILMINSAEIIVGSIGSALHSILFSCSNEKQLITLSSNTVNDNFLMIDALSGVKNTYIKCLSDFYRASDNTELDVTLGFEGILAAIR